jgi:LCP family protein required for cell wall assembly
MAIVLALTLGLGGFSIWLVASLLDAANDVTEIVDPFPDDSSRPTADPGVYNILILGSDSPTGIDKELSQIKGSRSDMMMLLRLDSENGSMTVMSIMRDSWVPIPGYGEAKINAAMAFGGAKLAVETVEQLMQVRIDHVSIIDLKGLANLTDALGGITVDNPTAFGSLPDGSVRFEKGRINLTGKDLIVFVRDRYSFVDGDYTRVTNQRLVLKALLLRAFSREVVTNPAKLIAAYGSVTPFLATDSGLNLDFMLSQLPYLVSFDTKNIKMFTMPNAGVGTSPDLQSIVVIDQAKLEKLRLDWKSGELLSY